MESIIKYLDCGPAPRVVKRSSTPAVDFKVGRFDNIAKKVIPFLQNIPYKLLNEMIIKIELRLLF